MMPRCSSTVGLDALLGQEVVDPHDSDAFVDRRQHLGEGRVAAGEGEADVEVLVDEHEVGVGVLGGIVLECHPVTAEVLEGRAVVGHGVAAVADRAPDRGEFERLAHLVELGDAVHVRERRFEPAFGVTLHVAFGVEAGERLADRCA